MTQVKHPRYPAVQFIIRFGSILALIIGILPVLAGALALMADFSGWWLIAGAAASPVLYLIACSYVELIRIIGDTLLPR